MRNGLFPLALPGPFYSGKGAAARRSVGAMHCSARHNIGIKESESAIIIKFVRLECRPPRRQGVKMKRFLVVSVVLLVLAYLFPGRGACAEPQKEYPQAQVPAVQESGLSGKVVETMDSGGYTYAQIETAAGKKLWVAVPKVKITKGQNISFVPGATMSNFHSKTLKRTFDEIIFSPGPLKEQKADHGPEAPGSKAQVVTTTEHIKVEKASGKNAYTIGELYKNSKSLDKKNVVVKAKVVKVSEGIMGKNWLHIQDGTGDAAKGTRDLVVTTADLASVGDVVTVSGTLAKDKDFGAGYKYKVIIENATVKK
jgi:hypothetical protein